VRSRGIGSCGGRTGLSILHANNATTRRLTWAEMDIYLPGGAWHLGESVRWTYISYVTVFLFVDSSPPASDHTSNRTLGSRGPEFIITTILIRKRWVNLPNGPTSISWDAIFVTDMRILVYMSGSDSTESRTYKDRGLGVNGGPTSCCAGLCGAVQAALRELFCDAIAPVLLAFHRKSGLASPLPVAVVLGAPVFVKTLKLSCLLFC
jgi:hypothetical protein